MADIKDIYKNRIKAQLRPMSGGKGLTYKRLYSLCKGKRSDAAAFASAVAELKRDGIIFENKNMIVFCDNAGLFRARVVRINKTFGFIGDESGKEYFVPGKFLMGAMPGDKVMAKLLPESGKETPECQVVSITETGFSEFSGVVRKIGGRFCVIPDDISNEPIEISALEVPVRAGDKVLAEICFRGERHSAHRAKVTGLFGSSGKASSSAEAILYMSGIETEFPSEVLDEARQAEHRGVPDAEASRRLDLRDSVIFTIDGADTKDIDDAVSLSRTPDGWALGVHIADVSYYVKAGSALDRDAMLRGTSVYYADKVVPMLPKELSNGICSLNPNEDRLAFSCLMKIDAEGRLVSYKFSKSVIRSRVKGVYSEINTVIECLKNGSEVPEELALKYGGITETIMLMDELAEILTANKLRRGAPQIDSPECKLIVDDNGVCVDVKKRERGRSELIIEEFMLMANTSAARLAREQGIPFVYRVHEDPAPEKVQELVETVSQMGIEVPHFSEAKPAHLAAILEKTADLPLSPMINNMVLRSMAKAKYSDEPLGHFGLVLADYSHFTSPIRRYPDLAIHRILTDLCYNKQSIQYMQKRYKAFAAEAARISSERELTAMRAERECEDRYIAEYMSAHIGESFEGTVSSVQEYGFFVELPNTVEGLVRIDSLKDGPYDFDGKFTLMRAGKPAYRIGDRVRVICSAADISSGQVDMVIE